jgi:hypothetical protein
MRWRIAKNCAPGRRHASSFCLSSLEAVKEIAFSVIPSGAKRSRGIYAERFSFALPWLFQTNRFAQISRSGQRVLRLLRMPATGTFARNDKKLTSSERCESTGSQDGREIAAHPSRLGSLQCARSAHSSCASWALLTSFRITAKRCSLSCASFWMDLKTSALPCITK